ncbi:pilus assembly protein PilP [Thaumasiovibrio subtropicus]|uniref:pilus assembly protein PilP n=1 Tax=Thaumasiovibrio subtropicus TaxID=1891207 RepID=UPI000B35F53E|nr:pilus assembly protein PilP [Thaumasiovibrio subtropicus]
MATKWKVTTLAILVLLGGCKANDESIPEKVMQIRARATAKVEPLPDEFVYSPLPFYAASGREPFTRPIAVRATATVMEVDCWQPDLTRSPQKLEQFSIDTLAVKGIIGDSATRWALVQTPEGSLEKIRAGQFMGLNRGRVKHVTEFGIEVQESLPDGLGCWQQRSLKLAVNQPVSVSL